MMNVCPICGRYHCIHWPEHWVYRRGETYYCSAMCMDVDIVRDMNILKQVREDRRKRKEAKKMYNKLKKDGTPAKKSGPKKKAEVPEPISGGKLEKAEIPEEEPERSSFNAIINPLPVIALQSRVIETGTYRKLGKMVLDIGGADYLSMTAEGWRELSKEILTALDQLGVKL